MLIFCAIFSPSVIWWMAKQCSIQLKARLVPLRTHYFYVASWFGRIFYARRFIHEFTIFHENFILVVRFGLANKNKKASYFDGRAKNLIQAIK